MAQTDRILGYVGDSALKVPCRAATITNITLSGLQTIDGVALADGDRVLVKNQTVASENGIYAARATVWTREPDFDGSRDVVQGTIVTATQGVTNTRQGWSLSTSNPIAIGTTALTFIPSLILSADSAAVGYLPAGVGAVATSVQSKLRETVSVEDFGAVGDGVTDDTVAIQAAILAISNGGKLIFKANSIYSHSGLVVNLLNITFEGANSGNTANANSFSTTLAYTGGTGSGVTFTNASYAVRNINLKNIAFQSTTTGSSVSVTNCAHLHISGCRFQNNSTTAMGAGTGLALVDVFQSSISDSVIAKSNATARATGSIGLSITRNAYTIFGSYIITNTTVSQFNVGVNVGSVSATDAGGSISNVSFIGSDFSGCGNSIQIGGGTNNASVRYCYIEGSTASGVGVYYNAKNVEISNNLFNNPGAGVVADIRLGKGSLGDTSRDYEGCSIQNNYFKEVSTLGVQLYGNAGPRNVRVVGNSFVLGTAGARGILTGGLVTSAGTGTQASLEATLEDNNFSGFALGDEVSLGSNIRRIATSGVYQGNIRLSTQTGAITLAPTSDRIQTFTSTAAAYVVKLPLETSAIGKDFLLINSTSSSKNVIVQTNAGGALITLTPGQKCLAWNDGTTNFTSLLA